MSVHIPLIKRVLSESQKVILGKELQIKLSLAAFISGSHLLIEDIPGMGKTTLAKTLAKVLGLKYSRIQFTNDLLPSDITGVNIYNAKDANFQFKKGAIFSEFLLADEINRASSKTQSALLEAMEEKQISVDGTTYTLPQPFFVIATKNPFEEVGTYELPSSQLDRFGLSFSLGYPSYDAEREILLALEKFDTNSLESLTLEESLSLQNAIKYIHISDEILTLIQEILSFTRESSLYVTGLSTRAALNIVNIAKAWAIIEQREYVVPQDILDILPYIIAHRLQVKGKSKTPQEIYDEIIKNLHIDT